MNINLKETTKDLIKSEKFLYIRAENGIKWLNILGVLKPKLCIDTTKNSKFHHNPEPWALFRTLNKISNRFIDRVIISHLHQIINMFLSRNNERTELILLIPQIVNEREYVQTHVHNNFEFPTQIKYRAKNNVNRPTLNTHKNRSKWLILTKVLYTGQKSNSEQILSKEFDRKKVNKKTIFSKFNLKFLINSDEKTNIYEILRKSVQSTQNSTVFKHFSTDKTTFFEHICEDKYIINTNHEPPIKPSSSYRITCGE